MIKRFLRTGAMLLLAAVLVTPGLSLTAPAQAEREEKPVAGDGCPLGDIVLKRSRWAETAKVPGTYGGNATYLIESYARYKFCPNGSRANKMQVVRTHLCITKTNDTFIGYFKGGYGVTNLSDAYWPSWWVQSNPEFDLWALLDGPPGGSHYQRKDERVCSDFAPISDYWRTWQYMRDDPRWRHKVHFNLNEEPDREVHFTNGDLQVKFFEPSQDETVG